MRIAYNNYSDNYTIFSSSTAITNYPVSNVQDSRLSQTYRTSVLSGASIILNLNDYNNASAWSVATLALINHNLTSSATVIVSFDSIYTFVSATTQSIAYNANMMLTFCNIGTFTPTHFLTESGDTITTENGDPFINESILYAKVTINDGSNPDGYLELGRVWIGDYMTIDPSSLLDFKVIKKRSDYVQYGRNRQKWSYKGFGWRRFELNFPPTEEAMLDKIITMYDTIGNYKSLIFCNFDTIRNYVLVEPCYCSIDGDLTFNHTERMMMTYSLNLEEDL